MRIFAIIITTVLASIALTGCSVHSATELTASANPTASKQTITRLSDAHTITLTKKVVSIHDQWKVTVDGKTVGHIDGRAFRSFGNMWALTDNDGDLVDAASEKILTPSHQSIMYDYTATKRGTMRASILSIADHFKSENVDAHEKLVSLTKHFTVHAADGHTLIVSKTLNPVRATININPNGASEQATLDTIWLAVITNQLDSDNS